MGVYDSVVITGGGGMLAHDLAAELRRRGVRPHLVARAECDISRRDQVQQLFRRYRPTLLLNCAAHTKVDQCEEDVERAFEINGEGPGILAEYASEFGTHLTHFSTDFVFDGQSDRPYLTSDRPSPLSVYGNSKLEGEKRVQNTPHGRWTIIRTAWLYGGHGHCFPGTILKAARAGQKLSVVNDQFGCPTFSVDLAATTLQLIDRSAVGLFHVTNAGKTTWFDFAQRILEVFGLNVELKPVSTEMWTRMRPKQARRPRYSVLDCSETMKVTGTPMRQWQDALLDYRRLDIC